MKKILFTLVDLNIGGVQKTLVSILNNFDYQKYQVDLMILEKKDNKLIELLPKNVSIKYLSDYVKVPVKKSVFYRIDKNIAINKILKLYKNKLPFEYDVAIAFNGFNNYADLICKMVKAKKKIIWVHNDFYNVIKYSKMPFIYNKMYQMMGKKFKYFDEIAIVCDSVANTFNKLYQNQYQKKVKVINNYIDTLEIIEKSEINLDFKLSENFNIVTTGRLCKAKNFEKLVRLHKRLIDQNYLVNTYVIGDGEKRSTLENLIKKYNLDDSFKLLGKKINPYSLMKQANLFVSTSIYESYANTIIESLILGIPVVATNTSGAINIKNNIIDDDALEIGNNEEELFNLIKDHLDNPRKINKLDYEKTNKKVMKDIYKLLS